MKKKENENLLEKVNHPMITTIIPTYRRPKLLRRAILSVLNQTYKNIQVCVFDNASGDETASVVAELARIDDRVKYFCHHENIGPLKNYVFGLNSIETPFFSLFADDDLLLPNFYEDAMSDFDKHPEAMFVSLSTAIADPKGRVHWESTAAFKEGLLMPPDGLQELLKKQQISLAWTSILYRKDVLDKGLCIDERLTLISDVDWGLKCCSKFPFVINAKRGAVFSANTTLISFKNLVDDVWPDWKYISENVMSDEGTPLNIKLAVNEWLINILHSNLQIIIRDAILLKKYDQAYKALDVMRNYCKQVDESERLFKRVVFFERSPLLQYLFYTYSKAKFFYVINIKTIFITHPFKKEFFS